MAKKTWKDVAGNWLFLVGIVIAIILGIFMPDYAIVASLLVLIGIVVGLLNITAKETMEFLIASIALIAASKSFQLIPLVGGYLEGILNYILALVAPAAVIVALIAVWRLARTK